MSRKLECENLKLKMRVTSLGVSEELLLKMVVVENNEPQTTLQIS
jgi:hypothetical protein